MTSASIEPGNRGAVDDAARFGRVSALLRSDGRFNLDLFLQSFERGAGGMLVLSVPKMRESTGTTLGPPEARFLSFGSKLVATDVF